MIRAAMARHRLLSAALCCTALAIVGAGVHLTAAGRQEAAPAQVKLPVPPEPPAPPDLATLYETRQWFELRDAVKAPTAEPFLRAAVAAAFNAPSAEKDLRAIMTAGQQSDVATEARATLISLFERNGRFVDASRELNVLMASNPDAPGIEDAAGLFSVFAKHPPQTLARPGPVAVTASIINGGVFVPITINGVAATYLVDTAASISRLSGAEARRAGLQIERVVTRSVDEETGAPIYMRLAVADTLSIGALELRNVAFMVVNDDEKPFSDLQEGQRGALGLPVLIALRNIRWNASGRFEAALPLTAKGTPRQNLCFDGLTPLTEVAFGKDAFSLVLDSAAAATELWPFFAHQFPALLKTGKAGTERVAGVKGRVQIPTVQLSSVDLRIGGRVVPVGPVKVMEQSVEPLWYHGRLGNDVLSKASRVTIDFQRLLLTIE